MSFVIYDLTFLVVSLVALGVFFYKKRKNFSIEGPMYLYRTKFGLKIIDWFGKKHAKWLRPLQYAVVSFAYILMVFSIWLIAYSTYLYIRYPAVSKAVKAPPIFPIFPYFTKFFGLSAFFPPFYFTYFIISIAIVAIFHEFSHGIFAKLNKIGIHSTGFGFLRLFKIPLPFLGAFVEQDDKQMQKAGKFEQLSVLGAGVFANIVLAGLFLALFWLFFLAAFQPIGVGFNDYATSAVNVSEISAIQGIHISSLSNNTQLSFSNNTKYLSIESHNITYFTTPYILEETLKRGIPALGVYENSPAFNASLRGVITSFDGKKVDSTESLINGIHEQRPGDRVKVETIYNGEKEVYDITLSERNGVAYLGISAGGSVQRRGIMSYIVVLTPKINDYYTGVVYESKIGEFGVFIFNLFWWIVIINALVALFNMLPLGALDGGRFFMITIWGITGSKKAGEKGFKWATWVILALLAILMLRWIFAFF